MIFKSLLILCLTLSLSTIGAERASNTVILEESAVANLQLQFAEAEESTFEETVFALGHIEVMPGKKAVVSSRIPGRAFSVLAVPHQTVEEGDEVAWVESRQPGDPPPTVALPAPISGIVSKVEIAVGQPISPDQALMEIVDLETVEASAQVPQHLAGKLKVGQMAHIRVSALPDKVFEAKLAHLGVFAEKDSGTLEAAFHVPNDEDLLRPGMKAEFNIVVSTRENVLSVPREAIQGDATERFVYIKDYELKNAFVKTPVVLGARNAQFIEVTSGLFPGDEVVTQGSYTLAFAGKGSVSLREAMDAAHGHPHNDDGTEMSKEQIDAAGKGGDHDHDHEGPQKGWTSLTLFFACTSGFLLLLLILTSVKRKTMEA